MSLFAASKLVNGDAEPPNDSASRTPFGTLEKLPKEIRDMIFIPVLANGSTSLIRTSKAIYNDTQEILNRYGVYRVDLEGTCLITQQPLTHPFSPCKQSSASNVVKKHRSHINASRILERPTLNLVDTSDHALLRTGVYNYRCPFLEWNSPSCLAKAQNLDIRITLSTYRKSGPFVRSGSLAQVLHEIVHAMDRTVNCYVKIEFDKQRIVDHRMMSGITVLRGFKTVTLVLAHPVWQTSRPLWYNGVNPHQDIKKRDHAIWALKRFLGPSRRHGRGPELTIISTDSFIEDSRLARHLVDDHVTDLE